MTKTRSTTIISVMRGGEAAMGADGQISIGETVLKTNADKIRTLYEGRIIIGFAGATCDAMALFELFESKLELAQGKLTKAAVDMGKEWRQDKMLRQLEASLIVTNEQTSLMITGVGDVIESQDGILAIGSGGDYALSAAKALLKHTRMSASRIVKASLDVAADLCVYTNHEHIIKTVIRD